jgi:hypothetical protein
MSEGDLDRRLLALLWLAVVVAACVLRLWHLPGQLLIDDEWHAIHKLMRSDYAGIFLSFGQADYSIPLTLLFKSLAETIGLHEWQMRLLPMAFGLATVVVVPLLLKPWLKPDETALLAALIAISPLLVHFSRYVRPYAMILLLGFVALIMLWQWWHHEGRGRAVAFFVSALLAAWLHPLTTLYTGAALTWFAVAGAVYWYRGGGVRPLARVLLLGGLTTAACSALILPPLLADPGAIAVKSGKHSIELHTLTDTWKMALGVRSHWLSAILALPVAVGVRALWQRDRLFLGYWLVITLAAGLVIQLLGPEWIRNALVLVRYTVLSVPFVLALFAIGLLEMVRAGVRAVGMAQKATGAAIVALAAGLYAAGPLPATYSGVNQFTNSVRYQIEYDFDNSIFTELMGPLEVPEFYREIAAAPGQWRVVEAAWHFETHHTPISQYQLVHQRPIRIGMISGLCTDWTWGELRPGDEFDISLNGFVFLEDLLEQRDSINRFVVFPLDNPFEWSRALPELGGCVEAFRDRFGDPWHESEDFVVFRIPGKGRAGDA